MKVKKYVYYILHFYRYLIENIGLKNKKPHHTFRSESSASELCYLKKNCSIKVNHNGIKIGLAWLRDGRTVQNLSYNSHSVAIDFT